MGLAESNEDQFFVRNFFTKSTCDERVNARRSYERWMSVTREREKKRERGKGAESKRVKGREEVRVIDGKLNGRMDGGLTPERPLNSDLFYRPLPHESGEF